MSCLSLSSCLFLFVWLYVPLSTYSAEISGQTCLSRPDFASNMFVVLKLLLRAHLFVCTFTDVFLDAKITAPITLTQATQC